MTRYSASDVVIEMTRRCNMTCDHCLRGDAQAMDLDMKYVRRLFDKVSYINHLTLTGGEPSLVPHIIEAIIEEARKRDVSIGSFYMATNGKEVSGEFLVALLNLWNYCDDNEEMTRVDISNDIYHDYDEQAYKKLSALRFVGKKNQKDYDSYEDGLIRAGRVLEIELLVG